jgi:hypothetical protein
MTLIVWGLLLGIVGLLWILAISILEAEHHGPRSDRRTRKPDLEESRELKKVA